MTPLPWQRDLWSRLTAWRDRMPHALLFHGRRGIGKRHLAEALARWLLCEQPQAGGVSCGSCPSCQLLASENHPDIRRVVPAIDAAQRDSGEEEDESFVDVTTTKRTARPSREIRIDQVRELADFLFTTSHRGGRRLVVLAPAESLNGPAANALLKMLEEPPAATVFLLVADDLDAVLPTVRSRCILISTPVPGDRIALQWLREQGIEGASERLAESGGAPCTIVEEETGEDARRLNGALRETFLELLGRGRRLTTAEIAAAIPKDVPVGSSIRLFQRWGWDLLAERLSQRVRYYPSQRSVLTTLSGGIDPARLLAWLEALNEKQAVSNHPLNARLAVEGALVGYLDAMRPG